MTGGSVFKQFACAIALICIPTICGAGQSNANVFLGGKHLDSSDWGPIDKQIAYGIDLDHQPDGWPVSVALNGYYSRKRGSAMVPGRPRFGAIGLIEGEAEGRIAEFGTGIRKTVPVSAWLTFALGGGIQWTWAQLDRTSWSWEDDDSDSDFGFWGSGEIYLTLGRLNLGVQGRYSKAEVQLFGEDVDAGGDFIGGLVGIRFN